MFASSITRLITAVAVAGVSAASCAQGSPGALTFTPFATETPGIYRIGQPVGWTVTGTGKATYTLKRDNTVVIKTGEVAMTNGSAKIETTLAVPGHVLLEVTPEGGKALLFGAIVDPYQLQPNDSAPADFDAFWSGKIFSLRKIAAEPVLTAKESGRTDVKLSTIKMRHVNGTSVTGQLAEPAKPGKYPAILMVQWAGGPYRLERDWVVGRAAQGFIVLNIEPHDVLPDGPPEYYENLPKEIKNYTAIGQDDREKSYFVEMYLRGVRALDYLKGRPDWDGETLIVTGGSMGGQQTLCLAGLDPDVTHIIAEEPAGCDQNGPAHQRYAGYPFFGNRDPKVVETGRYIDAVNFAPRIRAKALVGIGLIDMACPPTGIFLAFNQIKGPKEAVVLLDAPHNNLATNEQMMPYRSRAEAWFAALAAKKPVEIHPAK